MAFGFTPAREQDIFNFEETDESSSLSSGTLNGEEARRFYENVITTDKTTDVIGKTQYGRERQIRLKNRESNRRARRRARSAGMQQNQTDLVVERRIGGANEGNHSRDGTARETRDSERSTELLGLRFLRCAHEGDLSALRDLLSKGVDINFQVDFLLKTGI